MGGKFARNSDGRTKISFTGHEILLVWMNEWNLRCTEYLTIIGTIMKRTEPRNNRILEFRTRFFPITRWTLNCWVQIPSFITPSRSPYEQVTEGMFTGIRKGCCYDTERNNSIISVVCAGSCADNNRFTGRRDASRSWAGRRDCSPRH
jgi:hypothetical protein